MLTLAFPKIMLWVQYPCYPPLISIYRDFFSAPVLDSSLLFQLLTSLRVYPLGYDMEYMQWELCQSAFQLQTPLTLSLWWYRNPLGKEKALKPGCEKFSNCRLLISLNCICSLELMLYLWCGLTAVDIPCLWLWQQNLEVCSLLVTVAWV